MIINAARGSTLLVDEAYQLTPPNMNKDFGIEAIETIMATIEGGETTVDDHPAYIFAGYPGDMTRLFSGSKSGVA